MERSATDVVIFVHTAGDGKPVRINPCIQVFDGKGILSVYRLRVDNCVIPKSLLPDFGIKLILADWI